MSAIAYLSTGDFAHELGISQTQFLLKVAVLGIQPDADNGKRRLWLPSRVAEIRALINPEKRAQ